MMNPILNATHAHIEAGKRISRVTVDNRIKTTNVIFEFTDDTTSSLPIQVGKETFMDWWMHTGKYIRQMSLIKPLDELD